MTVNCPLSALWSQRNYQAWKNYFPLLSTRQTTNKTWFYSWFEVEKTTTNDQYIGHFGFELYMAEMSVNLMTNISVLSDSPLYE